MEPQLKNIIRRKLHQQLTAQHNAASNDFIADFAQQQLIMDASALLTERQDSSEPLNCLSLFAHNNKLLAFNAPPAQFDQVPFTAILQSDCLDSLLPQNHYHLLLCNLALDWLDAGQLIRSIYRCLLSQGEFCISTFGGNTALQLQSILASLDGTAHFNAFHKLEDIGDAFSVAGFESVVVESVMLNLEYQSVEVLLADAQRVFGLNKEAKRARALTAKGSLEAFKQIIEQKLQQNGNFIESVEILVARGQKPKGRLAGAHIPVKTDTRGKPYKEKNPANSLV